MTSHNKIVLMWLDSFSDRYLSAKLCPFLWDFSMNNICYRILPIFSYIGIKHTFEMGVSINTHRAWNDHVFKGFETQEQDRRKLLKGTLRLLEKVSPNDDIAKVFRYILFRLGRVDYGTPHLIPSSMIDLFPVEKHFQKCRDLYSILDENRVKCFTSEPRLGLVEPRLIQNVPRLLTKHDMLFIKLNSLDRLGHKYGPTSDKIIERITYLDYLLGMMIKELDTETTFILMSDHGMTPVTETYDLLGYLLGKGFRFGRHFIAFVGATYAAFWFSDEKWKKRITKELKMLDFARLLSLDDRKCLGIDRIGVEFGEEIFVANEHNVFFPEFYHIREAPKGMHGYAFSNYDSPIFIMRTKVPCRSILSQVDFADIMPTILRILNVPVPDSVEGHPLVNAPTE